MTIDFVIFSFDRGNASLMSRLVKTACFYADLATADKNNQDHYQDIAFHDLGIARASFFKLGLRNQLNTAFFPFQLPDGQSDRLLLTWDIGRPYEIDPETLKTLHPIGKNQDWEDLLPDQPPQPFKQSMSSAAQLQTKVDQLLMELTPKIIASLTGYSFILNALSVVNTI